MLRISSTNSTFPSKGIKRGHVFRPGHHAILICHSAYSGFANIQSQLSRYGHANETSLQVYKFKFDLQPGSLTDQVAGEHQP